jgi:hypothetical protein
MAKLALNQTLEMKGEKTLQNLDFQLEISSGQQDTNHCRRAAPASSIFAALAVWQSATCIFF